MSGRPGEALSTVIVVGGPSSPCSILKVIVAPSPVNDARPPFILSGALESSSFSASTTAFHSSGLRIYGRDVRHVPHSIPLYVSPHLDISAHLQRRLLRNRPLRRRRLSSSGLGRQHVSHALSDRVASSEDVFEDLVFVLGLSGWLAYRPVCAHESPPPLTQLPQE